MAQPLRIESPDAIYHIMARGTAGLPIVEYDPDKQEFLGIPVKIGKRFHCLRVLFVS